MEIFKRYSDGSTMQYALTIVLVCLIFIYTVFFFSELLTNSQHRFIKAQKKINGITSDFLNRLKSEQDSSNNKVNMQEMYSYGIFPIEYLKGSETLKASFYGSVPSYKSYSLILPENGNALNLSDNAQLSGNIITSKKGIRGAYSKNKIKLSDQRITELPRLKESLLESLEYYFNIANFSNTTSTLSHESLVNSFENELITYYSKESIDLKNIHLSGKISIISNESIVIHESSHLNNVLIIAPEVIIEKNFSGTIQVLASHSITVHNGAYLDFPSVLWLHTQKDLKTPVINVKAAKVNGYIGFTYSKKNPNRSSINFILEPEGLVKGVLYVNGAASIKGVIIGTLFANSLRYKIDNEIFNNHFKYGSIYGDSISESFLDVLFHPTENENIRVMKWLD